MAVGTGRGSISGKLKSVAGRLPGVKFFKRPLKWISFKRIETDPVEWASDGDLKGGRAFSFSS
jgi:hypothetical protein